MLPNFEIINKINNKLFYNKSPGACNQGNTVGTVIYLGGRLLLICSSSVGTYSREGTSSIFESSFVDLRFFSLPPSQGLTFLYCSWASEFSQRP